MLIHQKSSNFQNIGFRNNSSAVPEVVTGVLLTLIENADELDTVVPKNIKDQLRTAYKEIRNLQLGNSEVDNWRTGSAAENKVVFDLNMAHSISEFNCIVFHAILLNALLGLSSPTKPLDNILMFKASSFTNIPHSVSKIAESLEF